jgi:hypothetical protein
LRFQLLNLRLRSERRFPRYGDLQTTIWLFAVYRVRRTARSTHRKSNRRDRRQHWQVVCQTIGAALGPIGTGRIYDLMGSHSYAFDRDRMHCERARKARLPLAGVRAIAIDAGRDNGGVAARGSGTPAVASPGCPQGLLTQLSCPAVRMSAVHGSRAGIAASRTRAKSRLSNAEGVSGVQMPLAPPTSQYEPTRSSGM